MDLFQRLKPYLALTLVCLAVFVPGLTALEPLDRDESRFAQASKQMLETGDFIRIKYQETARNKKPAGAYWLQAASASVLGGAEGAPIWAYRLPSTVAAWLSILATFGFGASLVGRRQAFVGALLLATSVMVIAEAHQAKTDALLLLCTVFALGALGRCYGAARSDDVRAGWGTTLTFWVAIGAGVLVKGPVVVAVAGLTILALGVADRSWSWLKALKAWAGLPIVIAMALPWFLAVNAATDGGFVGEAVGQDLLPKLLGAQESHGGPPGLYLALMFVFFWPGSLFAWAAVPFAWARKAEPAIRFLIAWIVPAWLMFEIVPTKLPHYVLPTYPALALLSGALVVAAMDGNWLGLRTRFARATYLLWAVPGIAVAGAAVVLPFVYGDGFAWTSLPVAAVALATSVAGLLAMRRRDWTAGLRNALIGGGVTLVLVLQVVLPGLNAMWISPRAADAVNAARAGKTVPVAVAGYHEPSLVFLLGTKTMLTGGNGAAAYVAGSPGALALVSDKEEAAFRKGLPDGAAVTAIAEIRGFNYSRGKWLTLTLYGQQ